MAAFAYFRWDFFARCEIRYKIRLYISLVPRLLVIHIFCTTVYEARHVFSSLDVRVLCSSPMRMTANGSACSLIDEQSIAKTQRRRAYHSHFSFPGCLLVT